MASEQAEKASGSAGSGGAPAGAGEAIPMGRIYHDPGVPELVCRYPGEPTVTVLRAEPREVVVSLRGKETRLAVRNGSLAKVGKDYLMIQEGDDQGLWLLIEPGEEL